MSTRLERAARASLDAAAARHEPVNIRYLTGFDSSNAALLVDPGGEATLYTDFRYIESAREVPGVEAVLTKRSLLADLGGRLKGTVQFEADVAAVRAVASTSSAGKARSSCRRPASSRRCARSRTRTRSTLIRRAARIADRAFEALTAETWVGRSERELAWRLRELLHAHGADDLAFDAIVASGPNGALPHATPTDEIVETRTLVTVDWGARLDGYCSDCTRTVVDRVAARAAASRPTTSACEAQKQRVRRDPRRA